MSALSQAPAETKSPDQHLTDAYVAFVSAETAAGAGDTAQAVAGYRQALELYLKLREGFPDWRTDMVNYGIAQCLNRITKLTRTAPAPAAPETPTEPAPAPFPQPPAAGAIPPSPVEDVEASLPRSPEDALAISNKMEDGWIAADEREMLADWQREVDQHWPADRQTPSPSPSPPRKAWYQFWIKEPAAPPSPHLQVRNAVKAEARRLLNDNKAPEAVTLLRDASACFPDATDIRLMLGTACCYARQFQEAVRVARGVISAAPTNASAYVVLGTGMMGLGEYRQAIRHTERALKINPRLAEAHYNLAQMWLMVSPSEPYTARDHYFRSLELGGAHDPVLEDAIRRACLMRKAAEIGKKKPLSSTGRQSQPVGQGELGGNVTVQQNQP
jgi:Flp pilus assembly protein TadD